MFDHYVSDELCLALVQSTKAHADIVSIDWSAALAMPGVVDKIDHTDVPGSNATGLPVANDEEIFISKTVREHCNETGSMACQILFCAVLCDASTGL